MVTGLKLFSERSRYRIASIVLVAVSWLAVASVRIGTPAWLAFITGIAPEIVLTIITYHRLQNAGVSSGWLLLMILQFGIGPAWQLSEHLTFNVGGALLGLVPVILGWIVPSSAKSSNVL